MTVYSVSIVSFSALIEKILLPSSKTEHSSNKLCMHSQPHGTYVRSMQGLVESIANDRLLKHH